MDDERVENPLVAAAVLRIAERVGHPIECPLCGGTDWQVVDTARFMRLWAPSEKMDAELDDSTVEVPLETIRTLGLTCSKCLFLRLHEIPEEFGDSPEALVP